MQVENAKLAEKESSFDYSKAFDTIVTKLDEVLFALHLLHFTLCLQALTCDYLYSLTRATLLLVSD
jgi:hypothetical protein